MNQNKKGDVFKTSPFIFIVVYAYKKKGIFPDTQSSLTLNLIP